MIDIHTHILPLVDDGSSSVAESRGMLEECFRQGSKKVVLTPHFYADYHHPDSWFTNRQKAFASLLELNSEGLPEMLLGAEVHYFGGVSRCEEIEKFRIEGTELLLLEMPSSKWGPSVLDSVLELNARDGIRVILAHIERFLFFQPRERELLSLLRADGILLQSNAEFFIEKRSQKTALRLLESGCIDFLGSDCHNLSGRAPNLGTALSLIQKYGSKKALALLEDREKEFFFE